MTLLTKYSSGAAVLGTIATIFLFSTGSQADHHAEQAVTADKAAVEVAPKLEPIVDTDPNVARVREELGKMIPQAGTAEIISTPAKGVYRMQIQGSYAYAYIDGDFVLIGDLYNTVEQVNLGNVAQSERMASLIQDMPATKMIVYGPEKPKRYITVFTDIDCGYCQKLHREVPKLTAAGVQVRYLAFPRAGIGSKSHKKYISVWCNSDQQTALTDAKAGRSLPTASCDNPIEESYNLGQQVGVRGTPTIIFDDGTVTPGYVPHKELLKRLGIGES